MPDIKSPIVRHSLTYTMCAAKKQKTSAFSSLFAWLLGTGRPVLILLTLAAAAAGGSYAAWRRLGPRILAGPDFSVGPEQVEITPLPDWIHRKPGELQREVFRDPSLGGPLSLVDDELTQRIYQAFSRHPWIARVGTVSKHHPAGVRVSLSYRRPVCMVEVPGGVLAVDVEGVLLPSEDFSPIEAARYPHLTGVDRKPAGPPGRRWGDARVVGGAEIAAALEPLWDVLKLKTIEPVADGAAQTLEPQFALRTRGGARILWGYAPGANVLGEPPAAEKIQRLQRHLDRNGSLDTPPNFDLRAAGNSNP